MIAASVLAGIWSATITPLDEQFFPDTARALAYYHDLLEHGCTGVNVLGTTGEAMSLGVRARTSLMQGLVDGGIPTNRLMFGTGACALDDAVELNRVAAGLGVSASLVMPPFFYRDVDDDGILRFFDALFERVTPPPVLLYNFPKMSGVRFNADLVDRLMREFPGRITGMKDSSNDRALQREILERHPGFCMLPGSEEFLLETMEHGGSGCISGSVALWPQLAADAYRTKDPALARELAEKRRSLGTALLIPTVRERIAEARNDAAWLRAMPPL